jgi:NAD(P)-dependent dehydrogenase (short-subunit alcohol dehydrogenase family)
MKNYLVIGGSSGIGQELARQLSAEGHRVFATYNRNEQNSVNPLLSYHRYNVLEEQNDLSFLPEQLDGLAYCPGAIILKPFHRIDVAQFTEDYKLQVGGAVSSIQKALPLLKKGTQPAIVLFSTLAVGTGLPFHSLVSANKGAIEGLTRALAAEFAPQIRVNCIAPSLTDTPLAASLLNTPEKREANAQRHPLKKIGSASDIAALASFLLSEKTAWISGQVIHADGGMSALRT